jgi:hypothetical protein
VRPATIACQRLARSRLTPAQEDEAPPDELVRVEAEDEEGAVCGRHELQPGDGSHARLSRDLGRKGVGQQRAAEVGHVGLEEPEVRVADVDQRVGRSLHACRDRQQRDDQADAQCDACGREHRSRGPAQEVAHDDRRHRHRRIMNRYAQSR